MRWNGSLLFIMHQFSSGIIDESKFSDHLNHLSKWWGNSNYDLYLVICENSKYDSRKEIYE